MSSLVIARVTGVADCARVRPLVVAHIRHEQSGAVVPLDWAERTAQLIHEGRLTLLVALDSERPVGYATITRDVSTWTAGAYAHLDCLYVDDEHRNAGVGRQLVDGVITCTREHGIAELQWQTPPWNEAAIRFYERLGAHHQLKERFTLMLDETPALVRSKAESRASSQKRFSTRLQIRSSRQPSW